MQAKPYGVTVSLEFDASAMRCRVRSGLVDAAAKYHVLEPGQDKSDKSPDPSRVWSLRSRLD